MMDNLSNSEENYDLESHPSSEDQIDTSNTDTACSTPSGHLYGYSRTSSGTSAFSESTDLSSTRVAPKSFNWPTLKSETHAHGVLTRLGMKKHTHVADEKSDGQEDIDLELEMMKEKFSKLLLGEDMSGSGKGVCTAVAISNAITNLYATIFGHCYRLEPLAHEKKSMWRREMDCLLSVCDFIVEFIPSCQNFQDGTSMEVMRSRPRSDIYINLPALQKLDTMLLGILESFGETEFWYGDERNLSSNSNNSSTRSFRRVTQRKEEKWWLPVPFIPSCGLSEKSKKQLQHKRDCSNQILKAAMAINSSVLAEMEVPETYLATLPKTGRASLGDSIYRYMSNVEHFSPDYLLNCLKIKSEHEALELADHVEASMYLWRRKACINNSKPSWDIVKDLMADGDKNGTLATRAESLLLFLRQRYPELSQTTLDTCKIQYNKDVGQAILESYSRVLESLAFNIVSWIDDVLFVDESMQQPNQ